MTNSWKKCLNKFASGIRGYEPKTFIQLKNIKLSNRQKSMNGFIEKYFEQMKKRE